MQARAQSSTGSWEMHQWAIYPFINPTPEGILRNGGKDVVCLCEDRTMLFLLPAVVAEGGDVVVLYAALHLSQIHAAVLLTEALAHVVRHTQGLSQTLLCVTYRTGTRNSTRLKNGEVDNIHIYNRVEVKVSRSRLVV